MFGEIIKSDDPITLTLHALFMFLARPAETTPSGE